ncbi:response regulator transcription factor [Ruegeria aquimaris]|uniref:Response regulator transcription factor n=1 Tax=Ruegeria aquimaris TaxID=2984333 RepID=A0ABT3AJJ3_9RHOB|nr:response regulator transcription factor [Ruegeria sp. XHP0148]MCV2888799.1 response regulator transcription factor [Ruegeria sp. XHP0148]
MKVLLADDHDLVRDALKAYLESEKDIVVTTVPNLSSACEAARKTLFDVVLLDYSMPGMNGLEGLDKAIEAGDGRPVAIMSGTASKAVAQEALAAGAAGFLPKTMGAKSLVNAVRFIVAGETYVPVDFMNAAEIERAHPIASELSGRELEVLERLCRGLANKEIARELFLQEVTIKLHVKTLCRKLNARNRTQAALIAKDAGLF